MTNGFAFTSDDRFADEHDNTIFMAKHIDLGNEGESLAEALLIEKGYDVIGDNFMELSNNTDKFDTVFMNPPFNVKEDSKAYISHIRKAYDMLGEEGRVIAIAPTSFINNSSKKEKDFLSFVNQNGYYETNDKGSFKESQTMVDTVIIRLNK